MWLTPLARKLLGEIAKAEERTLGKTAEIVIREAARRRGLLPAATAVGS